MVHNVFYNSKSINTYIIMFVYGINLILLNLFIVYLCIWKALFKG